MALLQCLEPILAHARTLEHELKLLREADGETMTGQRASRMSKWMQVSKEMCRAVGLSEPDRIESISRMARQAQA